LAEPDTIPQQPGLCAGFSFARAGGMMHPMIRLPRTLAHWNRSDLEAIFRHEVLDLERALLPLQQGLRHSSHALTDDIEVLFLGNREEEGSLRVKAGIFYRGVIAGCSCADDPTPMDEVTEYCELLFHIDPVDGTARVELL
jgi:hypothetical protein